MAQFFLRTLALSCLGVAATASCSTFEEKKHPLIGHFVYENAERTSFYGFENGEMTVGPISPQKPVGDQTKKFTEAFGVEIRDCSDAYHQCAEADQTVFAVPRKQAFLGMTYTIKGTIFTVEECLRGVGQQCQIALIKGDCQYVRLAEGLRECAPYPGGRSKSPQQGGVRYFIYNEDYGVTSFGSASDEMESSARSKIARQYILQGNVGLLAPESVSAKHK